jgi:hypothetical protein
VGDSLVRYVINNGEDDFELARGKTQYTLDLTPLLLGDTLGWQDREQFLRIYMR